jgi:ATP-binding cassette subfamily B protein
MKSESKESSRPASLLELLRHFGPEIRAQKKWVIVSLLALFAEVGLRLLEPWPMKFVFDYVLGAKAGTMPPSLAWLGELSATNLLLLAAVSVVVFTGLRALAAYWNSVGFAIVGTRVLTSVRSRLFRHLHGLPLSFHNRARSGDLVVRVISDVGMLQDVTVTALLPLVARLLILAGMVGVMFWMNWQLALGALALLPLFGLRTVKLSRSIREVAQQQRKREGAMAATAAESFSGMKIVQALAAADAFVEAFGSQNDKSLKQDVKGKRLAASLERSVDLLIAGATALVLWQGARLALAGQLTPGDLLVFLAYLKSAFRPVQDFAKFTGRLGKASAAGARVLELLQAAPEVVDRPDAIPAPEFRGEIRFENVTFAYESGRPVLENVSFTVRPGQTLAVLGASGGGKSTLLNLLARLHEPVAGRILIDGRDVRDYQVDTLRRRLGIVLQENVLFAGTVRDNIALGSPHATGAEIEAAAKLARAHEFIAALKDGYDTAVGERGATLSQGQRQRIAIARAVVRKASLLLFDEPTTGLDEANERAVVEGLRNLSRGRTTVWVTHNPRHAELADVVVQISGGRTLGCAATKVDQSPEENHVVAR